MYSFRQALDLHQALYPVVTFIGLVLPSLFTWDSECAIIQGWIHSLLHQHVQVLHTHDEHISKAKKTIFVCLCKQMTWDSSSISSTQSPWSHHHDSPLSSLPSLVRQGQFLAHSNPPWRRRLAKIRDSSCTQTNNQTPPASASLKSHSKEPGLGPWQIRFDPNWIETFFNKKFGISFLMGFWYVLLFTADYRCPKTCSWLPFNFVQVILYSWLRAPLWREEDHGILRWPAKKIV